MHPLVVILPSAEVIVGVPHASVAVAAPGAGTPAGLQPISEPGGQKVMVGGVTSTVHVKTCAHVAVFPQPSVAVYVRVCDRVQPLVVILPSELVMVGVPHASVATAVPAAGTPAGLQPRFEPAGQEVIVGGVTSAVQVNTWAHVAVLPQASVAVYVLVCDRPHPLDVILPSADVIVGVPQASVAVAAPAAGIEAGLHPSADPGGQKVMLGGVTSTTFTVCVQISGEQPEQVTEL